MRGPLKKKLDTYYLQKDNHLPFHLFFSFHNGQIPL
jgi:hypothetical protein